ncbi:MAG: hypothetical protein IPO22_04010 [Anaerolineales bacterium]|nr:hypothetical protein [Anaerolineales bacterium]
MDRATTINRTGLRKYLLYRGLAHLELGDDIEQAVNDLEAGKDADEDSYNANLALLRGYFAAEKYGGAFLASGSAKSSQRRMKRPPSCCTGAALCRKTRRAERCHKSPGSIA